MAYPYVVDAGVLDGLSLCCSSTCMSRCQSTQASNLSCNAVPQLSFVATAFESGLH